MNISYAVSADVVQQPKDPGKDQLSLKKAIKAYRDEYLTGLTDDEREEILQKAREYLREHPIETKEDREALEAYIKTLLIQFGFKGDIDECAATMGGLAEKAAKEEEAAAEGGANLGSVEVITKTESMMHFERQGMGSLAAKAKFTSTRGDA